VYLGNERLPLSQLARCEWGGWEKLRCWHVNVPKCHNHETFFGIGSTFFWISPSL